MPVTDVIDVSEERRQKRIILILFSVCALGASYLVYDYFSILNRATMPENLNDVEAVVAQWQAMGLVQSFDSYRAILTVNEEKWMERPREERVGIITQLARYCAERNKEEVWTLKVFSSGTSATLGEMGRNGLIVQ